MRKNLAKVFTGLLLCLLFVSPVYGQQSVDESYFPQKPAVERLVNDFAEMLSPQGRQLLEQKLDSFERSSSTQIAIVTVDTLYGMEVNDYATRLFELWGIGQKDKDNGVLILAKQKTASSYGEVFICTGYGVEEYVTDAAANRIIQNEMLPMFSQGKYYDGFNKAVNVLISLLEGKFTADNYVKGLADDNLLRDVIVIALIVIFVVRLSKRNNNGNNNGNDKHGGRNGWPIIFFGGRGFGGGGFGGFGGGGFGGFGGGSTGGGGAGGRW